MAVLKVFINGRSVVQYRLPSKERESRMFNRLTSNDPYMGRTAPLTPKRCILYIYSTNIGTEYFKHALYSPFFLFKVQFVSQYQLIWFLYYSHFIYRVCSN